MHQITSAPQPDKDERNRLRRLRYFAGKHELRIVPAVTGFSLVAVLPQRPVVGLHEVGIETIEAALGLARKREDEVLNQLSDGEVDQVIERVGPARIWQAFDRLTRPPVRTAAE